VLSGTKASINRTVRTRHPPKANLQSLPQKTTGAKSSANTPTHTHTHTHVRPTPNTFYPVGTRGRMDALGGHQTFTDQIDNNSELISSTRRRGSPNRGHLFKPGAGVKKTPEGNLGNAGEEETPAAAPRSSQAPHTSMV